MNTSNLRKFFILLMLIVLTSTFACGTGGRDVYEVSTLAADSFSDLIMPDDKPVLKKKILVTPIINMAGISDSQAEEIRQNSITYLSKDKYLLISELKNWGDIDSVSMLKLYGSVINPEYVKTAEEKGMNILLTCIIYPFEITEKRTGIWPFRKDSYNVLIPISFNALDVINGTLVVYEDKTADINIKKTDSWERDKWTPDYNLLKGEISPILKKLGSLVIEKLRKQSWQSKANAEGGNLVINAGKTIGINENTVFEIFKKGEIIQAYNNGEYYLFGEKIGETKAMSISEDSTILAANIDLKDAAFVRAKRSDE